jgi:hypothetical protein
MHVGIAVPEATYGVACHPAAGSTLDLHHTQPWTEDTRVGLSWWQDAPTSRATQCYNYTPTTTETVASVVDRFELDMVTLAHDKHNVGVFGIGNVSIKFPNLKAEEMAATLRIVGTATADITKGMAKYKPYFRCSYFDEAGKEGHVECSGTQPKQNIDCIRPGVSTCT